MLVCLFHNLSHNEEHLLSPVLPESKLLPWWMCANVVIYPHEHYLAEDLTRDGSEKLLGSLTGLTCTLSGVLG